jgi:hypothetical protein
MFGYQTKVGSSWYIATPNVNSLYTLGGGLLLPENQHPTSLFSFSHLRNATRMHEDRLSALHRMTADGFPITVDDRMTRWKAGQQQQLEQQRNHSQGANASSEEAEGVNRMGLGLPLSNIYARYFGGSLDLMSLDGWGESHAFRSPSMRFTGANKLLCPLLVLTHHLFQSLMDIYAFRVSGQTLRTSKFECVFWHLLRSIIRLHVLCDIWTPR